jgi:hypothetical protein
LTCPIPPDSTVSLSPTPEFLEERLLLGHRIAGPRIGVVNVPRDVDMHVIRREIANDIFAFATHWTRKS